MPDIFDQIEAPTSDIFDDVAQARDVFDDAVSTPQAEEPGRITRQPQTLKDWGSFLLGGMLHPVRQAETAIEQTAIQLGLAKPGSQLLIRPSEVMERPAVNLPRVSPATSRVGQVAGGLANAALDFAEFFLTPEGVMTMGLGSVKEPIRRAVLLDYSAQMAASAPDQFNEAYKAAKAGDLQTAVQHATGGTGGALLAGVLAKKGAFSEPIPPAVRLQTPAELERVPTTIRAVEQIVPPEKAAIPITEPIPLGANRPVIRDRSLEALPDAEFDAAYRRSRDEVDRLERAHYDRGEPVSRKELADAQDVYVAAELERYRRNTVGISAPDLFQRLRDVSSVAARDKTSSDFQKARIILEELNNQKVSEADMLGEMRRLSPDEAEVFRGQLEDIKRVAKQEPAPQEPPAIETTTTLKEGVQPEIKASPEGKVTGIKNAAVDAERQSRGQEPIMAPTRQRNQAVWDKAMGKIDSDVGWQDRLITEFQEKPRTPTAEEIVALDHRYVELQSEYTKSVAEGSKHFEEGNALLVEEAKLRSAFYESKLNELEQVSRKIGAEWGRSGQMRQRLMREDYSLAAMEAKKRAARGFEPLPDSVHQELRVLSEKLATAEKHAIEVEAQANQRIALVEAQKALAEAKTQAGQLGYEPRLLARAEKFAAFMDKQSAAASKRLRERLSRVSTGIDPTMLADVAIIGAAKITRGAVDSAKWIDEMARDYGEWIREHKDEAWAASQKAFDELSAKNLGADTGARRASSELARLIREKEDLQARLRLDDYSPRRTKSVKEITPEVAKARAEAMLLREQFERGLAKDRYERKGNAEKAWLGTKEGINLSRALMTSFDVSAVLRQGGFVTLGHPIRAAQSLGPMLRAIRSDKSAAAIDAQIRSRPNAVNGLYDRAKLFLAPRDGATLSGMEEAFMSKLARNIPGVAASQRAYVTFLNRLRADSFDQMHESLVAGREPTQVELEAIGNYINVATGRGNIGKAAGAAETLSTVFFAPRLVASRFQLLAGEPMYRGSARTRYMVAKEYGQFLVGLAAVYSLGKMAGATIEEDPRSTDFGKLKFGNTRVDPMAGLSQSTVLLSRLGSGETKNLKGQVKPIRGKVPYGSPDSADVIARFLRTKLAPWSGSTVDALTGENVIGEPVTAESIAKNMTVPLSMKDIYEVMTEHGIPHGTAISLLSLLGMSVQNYDQKKKP